MKKNSVHFILQGKGGVGKSLIAVLLAQYLISKELTVICADTDPVNRTFGKYSGLDVAQVEITENGNVLQSKFDPLMMKILKTDGTFVIDNGSATFLPLTKYLVENDIYQHMASVEKSVYIHTVLVSGQAKGDTYDGLCELINRVNKYAKICVWENEFWGQVSFDGLSIKDSKLFKEAERAGKIAGIVKISDRSHSDTFSSDMKSMTGKNMIFAEVLESEEFNFLSKNRLQKVIQDVFSDLDQVNW